MNPSDPIIMKAVSAVLGAVVSLKFLVGTYTEKLLMTIGGSALSFYASEPLSLWLDAVPAIGLVGFLLGVFGMAVIAKIYEVVLLTDAQYLATELGAWIKKKWGA